MGEAIIAGVIGLGVGVGLVVGVEVVRWLRRRTDDPDSD